MHAQHHVCALLHLSGLSARACARSAVLRGPHNPTSLASPPFADPTSSPSECPAQTGIATRFPGRGVEKADSADSLIK